MSARSPVRPAERPDWGGDLVSPSQATAIVIEALGLDAEALDFSSIEAMAELVRRTASITGPQHRRALTDRIQRALRGLWVEEDPLRPVIGEVVDALLGFGDLVDTPTDSGEGVAVSLASARFVYMPTGVAFLLGGHRDGLPILPDAFATRVEYALHTRRIRQEGEEPLADLLLELGLIEVPRSHWLSAPDPMPPDELIESMEQRLSVAPTTAEIEGLVVLDSQESVRYYRGRWTTPSRLDGCFVARRPQQYGSPSWCYVRLSGGRLTHLLDLPLSEGRGCDEAWTIQLALDSLAGRPQVFRCRPAGEDRVLVECFSPVPSCVQRRLDSLGEPVPVSSGALFAHSLAEEEYMSVRETLEEDLRMKEWIPGSESSHAE